MRPRSTNSSSLIGRVTTTAQEGGLRLLAARSSTRLLTPIWAAVAARRLRRGLGAATTLDERLDLVYTVANGGISLTPSQIRSELKAFLELLHESPPRAVVEIGTGLGGTTVLLAGIAARDAVVVTVDLPVGPSRARLLSAATFDDRRVHVLRADSHQPETREAVRSLLGGREVDVLLIDGDHSAEGVRADFHLYAPLVRNGGWIAFHDIVPGPVEFVGGVPRFWEELKREHEVRELVQDWSQGGLGIGVMKNGGR